MSCTFMLLMVESSFRLHSAHHHHTKLKMLNRDVECRYEFPQKWHLTDLDWRFHAVENQQLGI